MKTLIEYIKQHELKKLANSMIRVFMPGLISTPIAGVQPMTSPTSAIFTMKPTYSDGWTKMLNSANYDRAMKGVV